MHVRINAVLQLELWRDHAQGALPVLMKATNMLVCGEDLGFLAPCVHPLMKELGLVGAWLYSHTLTY